MPCRKTLRANDDELAISHPRWLCKKPKFKAREPRGARRACRTPQRQRDEAQRRNWAFYKAINDDVLSPIPEAARLGKPADLGGMTSIPEKVSAHQQSFVFRRRLGIISVTTQVFRLKAEGH
jgi:hypothetical protein